MSTVPARCIEVQAFYSTATGMIVREGGQSRPASLDEIEMFYGEDSLADVMALPGHWHDLQLLHAELPVLSYDEQKRRAIAWYDECQRDYDRAYDRAAETYDYHAAHLAKRELDKAAAALAPYLQPIRLPVAKLHPTDRPAA